MLIDPYERIIDYLRISVTDRCNLRCLYCMPAEGIAHKPHSDILSFEDIYRIVKVAAGLGVRKIRITGGEPLVRKDMASLIRSLKSIKGIDEITLTTNGIYLAECARELKEAGLDRVNVSLDSLIPERFEKITRGGNLASVLKGINLLFSAGLTPVKINKVLLRGFNEDEIMAFAELTRSNPIDVRFIEYMPTRFGRHSYDDLFFRTQEAKEICGRLGRLVPVNYGEKSAARVYRIDGFRGTIGFISPMSEPFCRSCNKLRLTADGFLKSCLHSPRGIDLNKAMREEITDEGLGLLIEEAVAAKPASHNLSMTPLGRNSENFSMCQIGG
ncbi:MAG: GTP 3',8-cyclase MoaA [Candidatus Omnitrophica bacterium]|nr:GTP 3',8-cyclase MoaA [Candidatus Omnitrophota bacterium]